MFEKGELIVYGNNGIYEVVDIGENVVEGAEEGKLYYTLKQIEERGYALPFLADRDRKLYKIGVTFDSRKRTLKDWRVAE